LDSFPFAALKLEPRQSRLRREWFRQSKALRQQSTINISDTRLLALTRDFWQMNKHKEFIKDRAFSNAFSNALTKHSGISDEICPRLLTILAEEFSLNTEGFSNVFQLIPFISGALNLPSIVSLEQLAAFSQLTFRGKIPTRSPTLHVPLSALSELGPSSTPRWQQGSFCSCQNT